LWLVTEERGQKAERNLARTKLNGLERTYNGRNKTDSAERPGLTGRAASQKAACVLLDWQAANRS
jgi:hypothetical protein